MTRRGLLRGVSAVALAAVMPPVVQAAAVPPEGWVEVPVRWIAKVHYHPEGPKVSIERLDR